LHIILLSLYSENLLQENKIRLLQVFSTLIFFKVVYCV